MTKTFEKKLFILELEKIVNSKSVLKTKWSMESYVKGWRYGEGEAIAVVKPSTLLQIWKILQVCVDRSVIVIMQAANTGLTGGSTPYGYDYDRPILVINTMLIDDIHTINNGKQIVGFPGSTLFGLEKELKNYDREPHSVIGSSCVGASIIGGVCNNSGGALVKRGPAYTELSLYAQINSEGTLILVNNLGIDLGKDPDEILTNLQNHDYNSASIQYPKKLASDNKYQKQVRDIDANTPARFNADRRRLYEASGCAGKIAVLAVRVDTFPIPKRSQVFYLGTNSTKVLGKMRRDILSTFKHLPTSGEYFHRDCYDAAKKYCKDTFLVIDKLGPSFIPKLFELKRNVDRIAEKFRILPNKFSDRLMQFLSRLWPNHLPKRMEKYRDEYEHHWVIEMSDEGIDEANEYFEKFFADNEGSFFICTEMEAKKAILHRFVIASATPRFFAMNQKKLGGLMSLDIALPRNEKEWFEVLPPEMDNLIEMKLYYGHLFCHVMHHNYVVKKDVNVEELQKKLLSTYDERGAEYPAEHNVGHEYFAKPALSKFYKELDPTNSFNPGIGSTSKLKYWK
tara:strand:+ start:450 stop:2150 length:1701 start_codon:yes stop_codon:yes gene_type:complete